MREKEKPGIDRERFSDSDRSPEPLPDPPRNREGELDLEV
jgi:hypothetical protein